MAIQHWSKCQTLLRDWQGFDARFPSASHRYLLMAAASHRFDARFRAFICRALIQETADFATIEEMAYSGLMQLPSMATVVMGLRFLRYTCHR